MNQPNETHNINPKAALSRAHDACKRMARSMRRDTADREDLFIIGYTKAVMVQEEQPGASPGYLIRVAQRAMLDELRRYRTRPETVQHFERVTSVNCGGITAIIERLFIDQVLEEVPAENRDILLAYGGGTDLGEIARSTGMSYEAVKARAHRWRNKARELLEAAA